MLVKANFETIIGESWDLKTTFSTGTFILKKKCLLIKYSLRPITSLSYCISVLSKIDHQPSVLQYSIRHITQSYCISFILIKYLHKLFQLLESFNKNFKHFSCITSSLRICDFCLICSTELLRSAKMTVSVKLSLTAVM